MKLKSRPLLGFLALTAALGLTVTSVAQSRLSIGGNESNFGTRALSGGFTPDPHEVSVVAGGSFDLNNTNLTLSGDLVVGDDDGIVVVAAAQMPGLYERCTARIAKERDIIKRIDGGATTVELQGLPPPDEFGP